MLPDVDRRGFLGTLLGVFATAKIPFVGSGLEEPEIQQPTTLPGYRTAIRLATGELIQGPGIVEINDSFIYAPIEARRTFTAVNCLLFRGNRLISERRFDQQIWMCSGDTLKITHTITHYGEVINPEHPFWEELSYDKQLHPRIVSEGSPHWFPDRGDGRKTRGDRGGELPHQTRRSPRFD
jgi:hypothetical protein